MVLAKSPLLSQDPKRMSEDPPKLRSYQVAVPDSDSLKCPPETAPANSGIQPESEVDQLTAEEQMARFEKELKENDWGHQPC